MLVIDFLLVLVFAYLVMRSHHEELELLTYIRIASPFIIAFAAAAIFTQMWRTAHKIWPQGISVWLITAMGGIGLRYMFGDGIAVAFQLVTLGVLLVFLVGRRVLTRFLVKQ